MQEQRARDTIGAGLRILGHTPNRSAETVRWTSRGTNRERIRAQIRVTGLLARSVTGRSSWRSSTATPSRSRQPSTWVRLRRWSSKCCVPPSPKRSRASCFHGSSGYRRNALGRKTPLASRFSSVISIDNSRSSELPGFQTRSPETGQFHLRPHAPPERRGFIDRTVAEVVANGKRCAALRAYPGRSGGVGVSRVRWAATPSCCRSTRGKWRKSASSFG